jgi:outer membrane protein OmpA-like peptidoglycan-associated protein
MKKSILILLVILIAIAVSAVNVQGQYFFGLNFSGTKLVGGIKDDSTIRGWSGLNFGYFLKDYLSVELHGNFGYTDIRNNDFFMELPSQFITKPGTPFTTTTMPFSVNTRYSMLTNMKWVPYAAAGLGLLNWNLYENKDSIDSGNNFMGNIGIGAEGSVYPVVSVDFSLKYYLIFGQNKDMSGYGDVQEGIFEFCIGFKFNFGRWRDTDGDGIENRIDGAPLEPEDLDGFKDTDGIPDYDNDGDGISDINDQCPGTDLTASNIDITKEDFDGFEDEDGCPEPDNDGDGIPDETDSAPNLPEDIDQFQDEDGAPEPDNDEDGIPDETDLCPGTDVTVALGEVTAEDIDGFQDDNGCPDFDNDDDGILDAKDMCPNKPETINGFQDEDGCPDKKPEIVFEQDKPIVLDGVTFEVSSSLLTSGAKDVLLKVVRTMKDYPKMKLRIEGHTDSTGSLKINQEISQRRADSVMRFLINQGVSSYRLSSIGKGPNFPITTNETKEGRKTNRRIEFIRVK